MAAMLKFALLSWSAFGLFVAWRLWITRKRD
jgi:hypothetical protein